MQLWKFRASLKKQKTVAFTTLCVNECKTVISTVSHSVVCPRSNIIGRYCRQRQWTDAHLDIFVYCPGIIFHNCFAVRTKQSHSAERERGRFYWCCKKRKDSARGQNFHSLSHPALQRLLSGQCVGHVTPAM